ncbi:MAG: RidA family protein [Proteobacteria bacterium]|nr:RidA family protein [Pseudomonadota bacterium]
MKKEAIFAPGLPRPRVAYSPMIKAGPFLFISGQLASDLNTGTPPEAALNPGFPHHGSDIERQTEFVCDTVEALLQAGGGTRDDVLFYTNYLTDQADMHGATQTMQRRYGGTAPPQATIFVEELPIPGCRTEIDLIAILPAVGVKVEHLNPTSLPAMLPRGLSGSALNHYGVKSDQWIFTGGIMATDFNKGLAPAADTTREFPYYGERARLQTAYILDQLKQILDAGGASLSDVVKAGIYLTDLHDFFRVDEVWREYFPENPPARCTVPVSDLGIPGARIAINLIAFLPGAGDARHTVRSDAAPTQLAHEPQAVRAGPLLFFSQQMATDFRTGVPPEASINPAFPFYGSTSAAQVNYIVGNVTAICRAAGTHADNLVRRRGFYTDFSEFFTSFATWGKAFPSEPPASTTVRVPTPLIVPGCKVAIDLIAVMPD